MFIDTHAHLTDEVFAGRVDEAVADWRSSGVGLVINMGYDLNSSKESAFIAQKYPEVYFMAGLHPTDSEPATDDNLEIIRNLTKQEKCLGVGEIGLDYHYGEDREEQKRKLLAQLALAEELKLPVSLHARDCASDMLEIVKEWHNRIERMVLHCYSLGAECAKQFVKYGCNFSFGGAITFKNNKQIYDVVKVIPVDRVLTETDCPYMTPVPFRGKDNEPKYVPLVVNKLAELYGLDICKMQEVLLKNTLDTFKRIKL